MELWDLLILSQREPSERLTLTPNARQRRSSEVPRCGYCCCRPRYAASADFHQGTWPLFPSDSAHITPQGCFPKGYSTLYTQQFLCVSVCSRGVQEVANCCGFLLQLTQKQRAGQPFLLGGAGVADKLQFFF